jgi:hypothetical protein
VLEVCRMAGSSSVVIGADAYPVPHHRGVVVLGVTVFVPHRLDVVAVEGVVEGDGIRAVELVLVKCVMTLNC